MLNYPALAGNPARDSVMEGTAVTAPGANVLTGLVPCDALHRQNPGTLHNVK